MNNTLGLEWSWINFHSTRDSIITTQYYSSFFYWLDYGLDYVKKLHLMSSKYPLVAYITCTRFKTQFYPIKYRINKITRLKNEKTYLQKKVLLPAWIGPFHRDCRRLHILQLQCYVRVELFRWNRCKSVLNRVHRHVKPWSPPRAREIMRLPDWSSKEDEARKPPLVKEICLSRKWKRWRW